ncbi:MAG TPA: 50S ribosomal protein L1 [Candidatus Omnitrophota bacterium]|nr:50S ribosomal protein L1 [Candidatus Omnitrophota bacterium]
MSKKYDEKAKLLADKKTLAPEEAVKMLKATTWAKFVESADLAIKLSLDTTKSVSIRGVVSLPHGSGKVNRVAVIASDDKVAEAKGAGAVVAGSDDLIEKISKGFLDFDVLIATPDMMGKVGKLGKTLGTKGLMPNPKSGTVTPEVAKAVNEFKSGKVEFRMDKGGVVHMLFGKVNLDEKQLLDNLNTAVGAILKTKPSGTKGNYFKSMTISTTMGPGIPVDTRSYLAQ